MNRNRWTRVVPLGAVAVAAASVALLAQSATKVDFASDVQPLLKERCFSCHGPDQQINGFRLDRRSSAMRRGTTLVPGSSETSRLYLRLVGTEFGSQMPPTGPLSSREADTIKRWIDQGAAWPDALANDVVLPPRDPVAVRMADAIRRGDLRAFTRDSLDSPRALTARGPGGSTPFMYAVLYGDLALLDRLLTAGADPSAKNDIGATALMWALDDVEKTRLLLERGADANAPLEDGTTPLLVASGQTASAPVVKLLLDRGANPNPVTRTAGALARAATLGNLDVIRMLLERGATGNVGPALVAALHAKCFDCVGLLRQTAAPPPLRNALTAVLPPQGDGNSEAVRLSLDLGADAKAKDAKGRTVLMLAASSDSIAPGTVDMLLARGVDAQAKAPSGETALDFARLRGATPVADRFAKADVPSTPTREPALTFRTGNTIESAVQRSLPLLQKSAIRFSEKAGCVSCHHNSLTGLTVATARKKGFAVDAVQAQQEVKTISVSLEEARERMLLGLAGGAQLDGLPYTMVGLAAEKHPPDAATDSVARGLKNIQQPDGRWMIAVHRPPLESSEIENTTMSMRALQLYAPRPRKPAYDRPIQMAAAWLEKARPDTMEDHAFRLLGMAWGQAKTAALQQASQEIVALQREDGGWSQLPSLKSDAYATGVVLVALQEAGMPVGDAVYQRGTRFLLRTQLEDGSWYVKSRALPIQPYFDSLFPHGGDQWISAAGTNWATMALALAR